MTNRDFLVRFITDCVIRSDDSGLMTEIVVPDLPYYDKPNCSSRLALLNMAVSDREKGGWFNKLKLTFGGRKK